MSHFPLLSGKEMIKVLEKIGYVQVRQKGSHIRLKHSNHKSISIPDHKELGKGLTRKIIKDANLTVDEFIELSRE